MVWKVDFGFFFGGEGKYNIFNSILSLQWQIYPSKIMFRAQALKGKWLRRCRKNAHLIP